MGKKLRILSFESGELWQNRIKRMCNATDHELTFGTAIQQRNIRQTLQSADYDIVMIQYNSTDDWDMLDDILQIKDRPRFVVLTANPSGRDSKSIKKADDYLNKAEWNDKTPKEELDMEFVLKFRALIQPAD